MQQYQWSFDVRFCLGSYIKVGKARILRSIGIMCDGVYTNRHLWKLHGGVSKQEELLYKVPNPFADEDSRYIYFVSDPPHLLKTIRNGLHNKKRQLWVSSYM